MCLINENWREVLKEELDKSYFKNLCSFIKKEYETKNIFPPKEKIFNALNLVDFDKVKVVIIGQDPYHENGQAEGLCFSVQEGINLPPSLKNIFKELRSDLGIKHSSGSLIGWAKQGVLLLNTVLTVRQHFPNSHKNKGWEQFTKAVIKKLNESNTPKVFILWGKQAQKVCEGIDVKKHFIIKSAHPSPFSANNGFFGSKPFSKCNNYLKNLGESIIDFSK